MTEEKFELAIALARDGRSNESIAAALDLTTMRFVERWLYSKNVEMGSRLWKFRQQFDAARAAYKAEQEVPA